MLENFGLALAAVDPCDDSALLALMYSSWDRLADLWCWTVALASRETAPQLRYLIRHMYTGSVHIEDLGDTAHDMLDSLLWPQDYADGCLAAVVSRCLIWSATLQLRHLVDLDLDLSSSTTCAAPCSAASTRSCAGVFAPPCVVCSLEVSSMPSLIPSEPHTETNRRALALAAWEYVGDVASVSGLFPDRDIQHLARFAGLLRYSAPAWALPQDLRQRVDAWRWFCLQDLEPVSNYAPRYWERMLCAFDQPVGLSKVETEQLHTLMLTAGGDDSVVDAHSSMWTMALALSVRIQALRAIRVYASNPHAPGWQPMEPGNIHAAEQIELLALRQFAEPHAVLLERIRQVLASEASGQAIRGPQEPDS